MKNLNVENCKLIDNGCFGIDDEVIADQETRVYLNNVGISNGDTSFNLQAGNVDINNQAFADKGIPCTPITPSVLRGNVEKKVLDLSNIILPSL